MATFAPIVGVLGLLALVVGCCMFLPLAALKRRRSLAKKLAIGGGVAFIAALVLDPTPASKPEDMASNSTSPAVVAADEPAAASPKPSPRSAAAQKQADEVMLVLRQTMVAVVFCTGEIDQLQRAIDKASAGAGTPMQAYSAAHAAERDCRKISVEYADVNRRPFGGEELNVMYGRALPVCLETARLGTKAAGIAKKVLDEESSMKTVQSYLDTRNEIKGKIVECKMGLQGLAEKASIRSDEVDFLRL